jgi:hypothetical protein
MSNSIIVLNVGGKSFTTTKQTLMVCPFFAMAFNSSDVLPATLMDKTGALFIDRSPELFSQILEFLRRNKISNVEALQFPEYCSLDAEADFYGLVGLKTYIVQVRIAKLEFGNNFNLLQQLWSKRLSNTPNLNQEYVSIIKRSINQLEKRLFCQS